MFDTNSTTGTQFLTINNILLDAHWQRGEEGIHGALFSTDYFAKDWDSIYVRQQDLITGVIEKNMRKLVEPTLVITQKKAKMAFVLASENAPVYLHYEFKQDKEYGYIMAFRLAPIISEEYVFYMCQYDIWTRFLGNNITTQDYGIGQSWHKVSPCCGVDPETGRDIVCCAENVVRSVTNSIEIPSLLIQQERIDAAKVQAKKIQNLTTVSDKELKLAIETSLISSGLSDGTIFKNQYRIGLLRELYNIAAGTEADQKVLDALSVEKFPFNSQKVSRKDLLLLSKNLSRVFPLLVDPSEFSWTNNPDYLQPKEVTDFIIKLAEIPVGKTVYNPFAGLASYAVALPDNHVVGEEINSTTWAIAQIRVFAAGADAQIVNEDSFKEMSSATKYDVIITSPTYLQGKNQEIADVISMLYDKLTDDGLLISLVPHSILSQTSQKVSDLRKRLIADKSIKGVITLPANIFSGISILQDVLFIQKGKTQADIIMVNAKGATRFAKSTYRMTVFDWELFMQDMEDDIVDFGERGEYVMKGDIATLVKYPNIIGTNLSPEIYLSPKPKDGKPLSELAVEVEKSDGEGVANYFIVASSLPKALHRKPFIPQKGTEIQGHLKSHVIIPGDAVLLSIVSDDIRSVYMENFHEEIAFPSGSVKVLKPVPGISAKFLAALLSTEVVADQIKAQTTGLTVPRLNNLDLSQVSVTNCKTDEERQELISEVLSSEMSDLEAELKETLDCQKREVRSTRHAMIQTLSALSSNWQQLTMFAQKNDGKINFANIISRVNPISVKELMDSIGYAISTLERQVESLRFEKADWGEEVDINPYGFINDYIRTHSDPDVKMVNVGSDNTADIPDFNEATGDVTYYHTDALNVFSAPLRLLERIFDNIVANAKAHGFTSEKNAHEIRFDWQKDNGNIVITIANNGLPLKEGVTSDDVLMSGFSTALNENSLDGTLHSGQGGFEIKSLMEGLGSVKIKSEPNAVFPVIYQLTFTKTSKPIYHYTV